MITRVVMPKLTDTMEEGVVLTWKKQEGDPVVAGDILAEIETDKAVMDLEAFGSGIIRRVLVNEGETVQAGALIAVIGELDEEIGPALTGTIKTEKWPQGDLSKAKGEAEAEPKPKPTPKVPTPPPPPTDSVSQPIQPPQEESPFKVSPRAKTIAQERGIDLTTVKGTGPGGRIIERDLQETIQSKNLAKPEENKRPLSQMRKTIARVMTQSKGPVPHFYLTTEIAMEETERLRHQASHLQHTPLSMTALLLKATAIALAAHPEMNVSYAEESIIQHPQIDIGIAVALDEGLISPVVRDCTGKNLQDLSKEARTLIHRAKNKQLQPEEYSGATFTISNLGMYGIDNFIAVLVPPQAAALAVGAVRSVPVVTQDKVEIGRRMSVTLSCDHRALDGAQGARFLQTLRTTFEQPLQLFLPTSTS